MFITVLRAHHSISAVLVSRFCFVFFCARLIGKQLAFAKWDKCMKRSSLAVKLIFARSLSIPAA